MTKIISAGDFRDQISEMLSLASYGGTDVVVTRFDRPEVVVIDYQKYQQIKERLPAVTKIPNNSSPLNWLVKLSTKVKGGPKDLSVNHDKYLYG